MAAACAVMSEPHPETALHLAHRVGLTWRRPNCGLPTIVFTAANVTWLMTLLALSRQSSVSRPPQRNERPRPVLSRTAPDRESNLRPGVSPPAGRRGAQTRQGWRRCHRRVVRHAGHVGTNASPVTPVPATDVR